MLFKVLSGKRWELLNAMTGAGAMSIYEFVIAPVRAMPHNSRELNTEGMRPCPYYLCFLA
jgi:predicted transcriptional regulator